MKKLALASLIFSSLVLSACSGGSGTAATPDGDKINLTLSPEGAVAGKTSEGILLGQNNSSSFYGVWRDDAAITKELRYQGTAATDIPKSGIAVYKGDAVWISGYDKGFQKGGITTLNVDFGQKTVDGSIKFSVLNGDEFRRDITLQQGLLNGSSFSGQATVLGNSGGRYEGGLFGSGGKEAAGVVHFENNISLDVSFGGTKQ